MNCLHDTPQYPTFNFKLPLRTHVSGSMMWCCITLVVLVLIASGSIPHSMYPSINTSGQSFQPKTSPTLLTVVRFGSQAHV